MQEALHNVAKHAKASSVNIVMERGEEVVRLCIEDDGQGMENTERWNGRSFGLAGMRERVAMLGGTVEVDSEPGRGTRIDVIVPMDGCGEHPVPSSPVEVMSARGKSA